MAARKKFKGIPATELKEFLDEKYLLYNNPSFIEKDPVSIPHRYTTDQDREIAGFLAATIAWGRRDLILKSAVRLMEIMGDAPYDFILNARDDTMQKAAIFVHRTFNGHDCGFFFKALRNIYLNYNSMEEIINKGTEAGGDIVSGLTNLRQFFFSLPHQCRTTKHFADVEKGAAGKRLFMFLRWMVRNDGRGVDFGIWKKIKPSQLYIPLDFHTGNTARKLGLLQRKQNDFKAVRELTEVLRQFDPEDPVKYDFALFGLGVSERF